MKKRASVDSKESEDPPQEDYSLDPLDVDANSKTPPAKPHTFSVSKSRNRLFGKSDLEESSPIDCSFREGEAASCPTITVSSVVTSPRPADGPTSTR